MGGLNVFLFGNKALLVLDVLPVIQIRHVLLSASVSQVRQLVARNCHVLLRLHDELEDAYLLLLNLDVLGL